MTELKNKDKVLLSYLCNKYRVEINSPLYKAAILLLQRLWQGSICISLEDLKEELKEEGLNFTDACLKDSPAVGQKNEAKPLIFDGENLYIQRYYVYQSRIIEKIENLAKNGNLHIITGGPGTGKTYSLSGILNNEHDKKVLLAAPTGKAAFRMTESLAGKGINITAKTIHRLLGSIHLSVNFRHNKENPLDAQIIAIDECSMIDIPLMAKLLDAIPENCHLYLLGDKNQLSPIEAGTVFADICEKYKNNNAVYTELKKNHRAESQEIIDFSKEILEETIKELSNNKVNYCNELQLNDLYNYFNTLLKAENPEDALNGLKKFQVLCAVKNGRNGTININKELLAMAKKENAKFTPIIITENNYTQNLFNGDIGVMDKETAYFKISEEKEPKKFPLSSLPAYENAFAITIHKSQGSEYDRVAVVYPDSEITNEDGKSIFTKELLYTAVTRAKTDCSIYGSRDVLLESCTKKVYRASGIK